jgi:hypothetical protein
LKVHGATGLRVVDMSVLPVLPSSHLSALAYAVGEKVSDQCALDGEESVGLIRVFRLLISSSENGVELCVFQYFVVAQEGQGFRGIACCVFELLAAASQLTITITIQDLRCFGKTVTPPPPPSPPRKKRSRAVTPECSVEGSGASQDLPDAD